MLRILESGNSLPYSFPVAPDAIFQPGTAMSLTVIGSQIFSTPSNGMSFIGVADDVKTNAFSAISWDEQIVVGPISPTILTTNGNGQLITTVDIKAELENPNVDENYFVSELVRTVFFLIEVVPVCFTKLDVARVLVLILSQKKIMKKIYVTPYFS